MHGSWARETGTGADAGGGKAGNHLLCHFMAVAALFVAVAPAACRLLPAASLFTFRFVFRVENYKDEEQWAEKGGGKLPYPSPCNNCVKQFSA